MDKFYVARQLTKDDSTIVSALLTDAQAAIMKCRSIRFSVHLDGETKFEGNGEAVTRYLHLKASAMGWRIDGLRAIDSDGKERFTIRIKGD